MIRQFVHELAVIRSGCIFCSCKSCTDKIFTRRKSPLYWRWDQLLVLLRIRT